MIALEDLKLNKLIKLTEDFFIENRQQFLQIDPVEILQVVFYHQIFNNIQKMCLETICFKTELLFNSAKFVNLPAPLLEIILKRDDLTLDEIEIWKNLLKWGLSQEKSLNENVSKWRQEEFNVFKRILYKFIPLVRFYDISSEDYFNKVRPYEEILSKELRDEVVKFHMVSNHVPMLNNLLPRSSSSIINQKHIEIFSNWIKQKDNSNNRYRYKLLYRASRDGDTAAAFHNACDSNKDPQ